MNWLAAKDSLESRKVITESGCWTLKNNDTNYPSIEIEGKKYQISRITKKIYQNIEIEKWALHSCDNPHCWNPDHIYDGDNSDNQADSFIRSDRISPNKLANRTSNSCPQGHEHNEQNTYFYTRKNGKINKVCKICSKEHLKNRRLFQRGS